MGHQTPYKHISISNQCIQQELPASNQVLQTIRVVVMFPVSGHKLSRMAFHCMGSHMYAGPHQYLLSNCLKNSLTEERSVLNTLTARDVYTCPKLGFL